jgi:hypothetical protein
MDMNQLGVATSSAPSRAKVGRRVGLILCEYQGQMK